MWLFSQTTACSAKQKVNVGGFGQCFFFPFFFLGPVQNPQLLIISRFKPLRMFSNHWKRNIRFQRPQPLPLHSLRSRTSILPPCYGGRYHSLLFTTDSVSSQLPEQVEEVKVTVQPNQEVTAADYSLFAWPLSSGFCDPVTSGQL